VRLAAGEHEIRFGYDAAGREVRRELPGGLVLAQAWDQRGRLTVQALSGADGPAGLAGMDGPAGLAGAVLQRRAYDYSCDGLVTGMEDLLAGTRVIGLDRGGRVTAVQGPDWSEQYAYDPAGNVAAGHWPAQGVAGEQGLSGSGSPGSAGQGLGASGGAEQGLGGRGGAEQGLGGRGGAGQGPRRISGTLVIRAGNVRYRHDRQGRVVQRQVTRISRKPDVWQYRWDASDRLTAVTTPDGTGWRYRYDPFGRRIAKQRLGRDGAVVEQTDFTWDGPVLAEQSSTMVAGLGGPGGRMSRAGASGAGSRGAGEDGPGGGGGSAGEDGGGSSTGEIGADEGSAGESGRWVVTWNYRPGSFTPLTQSEHISAADLAEAPQEQIDRRFYAIITDLVGSPTELADPDGALAGHQQHTLWGQTAWRGRADTPLRFPGQYADPETGLHYNQHRYYDPEVGAYLTPDPLGLAAAPNPHAYVMNPQVLSDPLGLAPYDTAEGSVGTPAGMTRVGRWMSPDEYHGMVDTGMVQSGRSGAISVARPPDLAAYLRQTKPGRYYVEFDVPRGSLAPGGKPGWAIIPGPNSFLSRANISRGLPPYDFPAVQNIQWVASKLPR
jgi:RHS repeat-associated protein